MGWLFVTNRAAPLELVPLRGGNRATPFTFDISMGVRKGDKALKAELEEALKRKAADIKAILEAYGVPLVTAEIAPTEEKERPHEKDTSMKKAPIVTKKSPSLLACWTSRGGAAWRTAQHGGG